MESNMKRVVAFVGFFLIGCLVFAQGSTAGIYVRPVASSVSLWTNGFMNDTTWNSSFTLFTGDLKTPPIESKTVSKTLSYQGLLLTQNSLHFYSTANDMNSVDYDNLGGSGDLFVLNQGNVASNILNLDLNAPNLYYNLSLVSTHQVGNNLPMQIGFLFEINSVGAYSYDGVGWMLTF
jgi:hypothetical protein